MNWCMCEKFALKQFIFTVLFISLVSHAENIDAKLTANTLEQELTESLEGRSIANNNNTNSNILFDRINKNNNIDILLHNTTENFSFSDENSDSTNTNNNETEHETDVHTHIELYTSPEEESDLENKLQKTLENAVEETEIEAEAKRKAEEEAKAEVLAEAKRKAEELGKAEAEAEAKRKAEELAKAEVLAEAKRKAEEQAKAEVLAEAKRKAEEQAKAEAEAEAKRKAEEQAKTKISMDVQLPALDLSMESLNDLHAVRKQLIEMTIVIKERLMRLTILMEKVEKLEVTKLVTNNEKTWSSEIDRLESEIWEINNILQLIPPKIKILRNILEQYTNYKIETSTVNISDEHLDHNNSDLEITKMLEHKEAKQSGGKNAQLEVLEGNNKTQNNTNTSKQVLSHNNAQKLEPISDNSTIGSMEKNGSYEVANNTIYPHESNKHDDSRNDTISNKFFFLFDSFGINAVEFDNDTPIYISWTLLIGIVTTYTVSFICHVVWQSHTNEVKLLNSKIDDNNNSKHMIKQTHGNNNYDNGEKASFQTNENTNRTSFSFPAQEPSSLSSPTNLIGHQKQFDLQSEHDVTTDLYHKHNVTKEANELEQSNKSEVGKSVELPSQSTIHFNETSFPVQGLQYQKLNALETVQPNRFEERAPILMSQPPFNHNNAFSLGAKTLSSHIMPRPVSMPPNVQPHSDNHISISSKENIVEQEVLHELQRHQEPPQHCKYQMQDINMQKDENEYIESTDENSEEDDGIIHNKFLDRWS